MTEAVDISQAQRRYFRGRILGWYRESARSFPWRGVADPYRVAVAETLLRQTSANMVVPIYMEFLRRYPDAPSLAAASPEEVRELIRPLGLFFRADQLVGLAREVVGQYSGRVPEDRRGLESLPGIGPYIAGAVLCFAFGQPEVIVDTNVLRVYRRVFGLGPHSTRVGPDRATIAVASAMLPQDHRASDFNLALLDFAALVCSHYSPRCGNCPVLDMCFSANSSGGQ